jgi:hypothetical protein
MFSENLKSKYALIIPESRTRPHTKGRLCRQVRVFLEANEIEDLFDIYIVTIERGIVEISQNSAENDAELRGNTQLRFESLLFPPKNFRSGRSVISKSQLIKMVKEQTKGLKILALRYNKVLVYARGSYLKSLQMSARQAKVEVVEVLSEYELSRLKKKGIMWMKVGLRMPVAFRALQMLVLRLAGEKRAEQMDMLL